MADHDIMDGGEHSRAFAAGATHRPAAPRRDSQRAGLNGALPCSLPAWLALLGLALSQPACTEPAPPETHTRTVRSSLTVAGLVAAYGFDEGTGTAISDDTENAHDAALTGQTWVAGKYGNALDFDGSYLTAAASSLLELDGAMTLSAWVMPTGEVSDWRTVIAKEDGPNPEYVLYADGNPSAPHAIVTPAGGTYAQAAGNQSLPAGEWSHLAATFDGSNLTLYLNGEPMSSAAAGGPLATSSGPLLIGGSASWGEYFEGVIDEVRVYDRALSLAELKADIHTPINPAGLDTTPPSVMVTAPLQSSAVAGIVQLEADASDDVSVANVKFFIDGNLLSEDDWPPYTAQWNSVSETAGAHSLTARAYDAAGNEGTSSAVSVTVLENALVAAYSFDEGSGSELHDITGNGNDAAVSGPTWATGKYGSALSFDGDYITIADASLLDLTTGITLSAWVQPLVSHVNWPTIILKEKPGGLSYALLSEWTGTAPSVCIGALGEDDDCVLGGAAPTETWTHLAGTFDGFESRIYVNGELAGSVIQTIPAGVSGEPLRIGGNAIWGNEYFVGLIDEVRVYARPLSEAEIQADMNTPMGCGANVDDNNECTADSCDPVFGITHTPLPSGTSCSDGNACNGGEVCDGAGACGPGAPLDADDGNPCTEDSCDPVAGLVHSPVTDGTLCNDGSACTQADTCQAGACTGADPVVCTAQDQCHGVGTCDSATGLCSNPLLADGTACDDGDACTQSDSCEAGACAGGDAVVCTALDSCHVAGACDNATGLCDSPPAPDGTICDDTNACTNGDACTAGTCAPGTPIDIDDQNPCTADSCDATAGVAHAPLPAGTVCAAAGPCTSEGVCDGSGVCQAGAAGVEDDGNPCTVDLCDPVNGPQHLPFPSGAACNDGNVCNGSEACGSNGSCLPGTPLAIPESENPCVLAYACDPLTGLTANYAGAGTACGTGKLCDGAGQCLRDQGDGTLPPPPEPGGLTGIEEYGPTLPRDAIPGCTLEPLDPEHVAVVAGSVVYWDAASEAQLPVEGARVTIARECRFGEVWTGADGTFRMPINGGQRVTVHVEWDLDGDGVTDYLPAERATDTRWKGTAGVGEFELVQPEEPAGTLDTPGGVVTTTLVLNGPPSVDDRNGDGIPSARTPSVLFKAGTQITAVDEVGATLDLEAATIRMTEYTVGAHVDDRMPAPMPPGTAYGYAVELSVDGAEKVFFDQPAIFYLDNFLGAEAASSGGTSPETEVGMPVPAWFYDRDQSAWQRMEDGTIIRIVGVDEASPPRALIDADDDGDADTADISYLAARGVTMDTAELEQLGAEVVAGRRLAGTELWRVEVDHFSTFDWNWILHCGDECLVGSVVPDPALGGQNGEAMCMNGSAIDVETRSLREAVPIAGTPFSLNYNSRFAYGYSPRRQVRVDRSWPVLDPPLEVTGVRERLALGGKDMRAKGCEFTLGGLECREAEGFTIPFQNVIEWDGRDANGQLAIGTHHGRWMTDTHVLAQTSAGAFSRSFPKIIPVSMTVYDSRVVGLGGWTLSPHHVFDNLGSVLFKGDGGERHAVGATIKEFYTYSTPALQPPSKDIVAFPDGSFAVSDYTATRYISASGTRTTLETNINNALAAAGSDRLFVGDTTASAGHYVRRYDKVNGVWQLAASLDLPTRVHALAVGPDNHLYTLEMTSPLSVRRYTFDLEPAEDRHVRVTLPGSNTTSSASSMTFDGDTLYIALGPRSEIYRLDVDADVPVLIGRGGGFAPPTISDGQLALSLPAEYCHFTSIEVLPDGVLWSRGGLPGVWRIDPQGRLRHVAGLSGVAYGSGDGGPPQAAGIGTHTPFDVDSRGDLILFTTTSAARSLRRISWSGSLDIENVPSDDGTLTYEFDSAGRHLRTLNTLTADAVHSFEYTDGLLSTIVHGDGEGPEASTLPRTLIERDVGGQVTIRAPSGQQTTLLINPDTGYAYAIIDGTGNTTSVTHDAGGLLQQMTDVRGFVHQYTYDEQGQLETDTSPGLAPQQLSGIVPLNVQHTSGENEVSSYQMSMDATGYSKVTRNIVNADASSVTLTADARLNREQNSSDGTTVDETYTQHPTFSAAAPVLASRVTTLPSGLQRSESHSLTFTSGRWRETFGVGSDVAVAETDPATNTVTVTSARGRRVVTVLDEQNRPIRIQVGDLAPTDLFYDLEGRLIETVTGAGATARTTTLDYFPDDTGLPEAGHLMAITDAANQNVAFTRDAFGRALSETVGDDTTSFGLTVFGDLDTLVTASNDTHVQDFNGVNLITSYLAPSVAGTDGATTYAYDNDRRLTTLTLPGGIALVRLRDAADPEHPERQGRLRQVLSLNSGNGTSPFEIGYAYADEVVCADPEDPSTCPPAGPPAQLSSVMRGDVTTTFTFDGSALVGEQHHVAAGSATGLSDSAYGITLNTKFRPQGDSVTVGDDVLSASYGYDADAVLTCAAPGTTCSATNGISYLFDSRVGDPTASGHGLLEGTTAQAIEEAFTYNTFGELSSHVVLANSASTLTINYGPRDAIGRILSQTTTRPGGTTSVSYSYDAKGQLHTVTPDGGPTRTNVYDANGNRLCTYEAPATECDEVAVYDAQDRLREFEGTFYNYTDRGTLFQRDDGTTVEIFTYDALGNLTQVAKSGAATIGYIIDAQSRRVGKQIDGVLTQQYVWSSPLRIAAELDGTGEVTARFIYGHGINVPALIVQPDPVNGDRIYRVITDHLGSPVYVVNVADPSDVLLDAAYDEWGNVTAYTSGTGAWPIPFGFAGGLYDEDTGLVRFGARDYDPRVGRWTAKDPIRFEGGQANLYVYVGGDPINSIDSFGTFGFAFGFGAGAGLGYPLGGGGELGGGVAFDWTPGQGFTAAIYRSAGAHLGAGVFAGAGVDFSLFGNIEDFGGTSYEVKADLGLLTEGGVDVGRPSAGKGALSGIITASLGYGAGLFLGAGASHTKLYGFRIDECGDGLPYDR